MTQKIPNGTRVRAVTNTSLNGREGTVTEFDAENNVQFPYCVQLDRHMGKPSYPFYFAESELEVIGDTP